MNENKHKRAAITNIKLLEDKLHSDEELTDKEAQEALIDSTCLGLSVLMHGLLYIGDEVRAHRIPPVSSRDLH